MRSISFAIALLLTCVSPLLAQTYTQGDTITVIQKPLINIPSIVRPGDALPINCVADPSTSGWTATLERGSLSVPLTITSASYDASTLWWTLDCVLPEVPIYDLYDLHVTADGGVDDVTRHSVKAIPEFRSTFEIIHVTDTHIPTYLYYYQDGADTDSTNSENLRVITHDINIINPEFVVLTGDLIHEGELEDYLGKRYFSRAMMHLAEFEVPVFLTSGNHDIGGWDSTPPSDGTARREWWKFFGWKRLDDPPPGAPAYTQDYSFDYGSIHFTALESYNNYDDWRWWIYGDDSFIDDQLSWLSADLAAASGSSRHVLLHHRDFQNQLNLNSLGIDLSLSGHIHYDIDDTSYPMDVATDNAGGANRPFRLVRFTGSDIDPMPTLSAEDENRLEASYSPGNDGSAAEVVAQVDNGHDETFSHALLRILMPGGANGYEAVGGTLTQVDDTGDHAVCYVEFPLPANDTVTITVTADTSTVSNVPAGGVARLLGARPNPFNPRTEIAFELTDGGPCRLTVFDLRGRELAVLVDGVRPAGRTTAAWDGRDASGRAMPSGTYFVGLRAGAYSEARKIVLAR